MTAQEKVSAAFQTWITESDPPPIGMGVGEWLRVIRDYAPEPLTAAEINEVGSAHWSDWHDQKPEDWEGAQMKRRDGPGLFSTHHPYDAVEEEFSNINDLFNKLHKALVDSAEGNSQSELMELATQIDGLHHDFAELVG